MTPQRSGIDWGLKVGKYFDTLRGLDGEKFIVDPRGAGDFLGLQEAIDACVDWRGDLIVCKEGNQSVDEAVTFDKKAITVVAESIGLPDEGMGIGAENFTIVPSADYTNGPAAILEQPVHLIGMGFSTRDLTGEALLIDAQGLGGYNGGYNVIEGCRFSNWYGSQAYGIRQIGGVYNVIKGNSFDGLFTGFATAAIAMQNADNEFTPAYARVVGNYFSGIGSGIPALKYLTGVVPPSLLFAGNWNLDGFGTRGVLLDNNSVVSGGLIADNWTGLANKAAAFLNLTNSNLKFNGNHYEE